MERVIVRCSDNPATLLVRAAAEFVAKPPERAHSASQRCLLAVRQGGLRDDIFRLAASHGVAGWIDPAICVFHEFPNWLGSTGRRPLGDFERAALLEHLMRRHAAELFRGREGAFLAAVDQLFGELAREGVTADALRAASAAVAGREAFEQVRDLTLSQVYRRYLEVLGDHGCRDGRDSLAETAAAVRADSVALERRLGGRREIRILGLADLRGGWRLLLEALAQSPAIDRIVIYHTEPLPIEASIEYLDDNASALAPAHLIAARDDAAELTAVAARVRALVEAGADPERIAVVARESRPHSDLALRALAAAGVPATARRRIALLTIPVVRAVLAVLEAAASGWTRHGLANLGAQPYFAADLDVRVINYLGYRRRIAGLSAWRDAFDRLLVEAQAAEATPANDEDRRLRSLPAAWVERARDRFSGFVGIATPMDGSRSLTDWLAWLDDWLTQDPWRIEERCRRVPDDRWQVVRLDLLGWEGLRRVVSDWREADQVWPADPSAIAAAQFLERLRTMLAGDVALTTETGRGVVVTEALAASHRTFDHVFLVGMDAGRFPRRAPSSLLLDDRDRRALRDAGLPLETSADWEARERSLFWTLVRGARRSLTLSYRRLDDLGGVSNPSAFVDGLRDVCSLVEAEPLTLPVCARPALAAHAHRVACIERERATGRPSEWNGLIAGTAMRSWLADRFGDDFVWSPTALEAYAKCPWSWFSQRLLHLEEPRDPDEDMDAVVRGSVLHDALRRFFDNAAVRRGEPVFLIGADREWALSLARDALREAMSEAEATLWLGHPALRDVKYAELTRLLERYLEFEIAENDNSFNARTNAGKMIRTAVESHEFSFAGASVERDGVTVRYRGIIDRIEVGRDPRAAGDFLAAVDYKTSKYSVPGSGDRTAWDDGVVLQIPLYAHALNQLRPDSHVTRVEYRALRHRERLHLLNLVRIVRGKPELDDSASEQMESALMASVRHVRAIREGRFPTAPAPSCHCPPFCHAWDVCRIAGGPDDGRDQ